MGNYERKNVINKAEAILEECNIKYDIRKQNRKNIELNIKVKRLKRKKIFWEFSAIVSILLFIMSIVIK